MTRNELIMMATAETDQYAAAVREALAGYDNGMISAMLLSLTDVEFIRSMPDRELSKVCGLAGYALSIVALERLHAERKK